MVGWHQQFIISVYFNCFCLHVISFVYFANLNINHKVIHTTLYHNSVSRIRAIMRLFVKDLTCILFGCSTLNVNLMRACADVENKSIYS